MKILKCLAIVSAAIATTCLAADPPILASEYLKRHNIAIPAAPEKFNHPGNLTNLAELQQVRAKIEAGQDPWASAFKQLKETSWAQLKYKPKARETVSSGILGAGGAASGSFNEHDDAIAAYTHTLLFVLSGDERHAAKAAEIYNAWSAVFQRHEGFNWYLPVGWEGDMFTKGAELLRATYKGWSQADQDKFTAMLNRAFLPYIHNRNAYGNREFACINGLLSIGVFNNDRAAFAEGLAHWVSYVPCWLYLKEDGTPIQPDYWNSTPSNEQLAAMNAHLFPNPKDNWVNREDEVAAFLKEAKLYPGDDTGMVRTRYDQFVNWSKAPEGAFIDGLCNETFRDMGHVDLGFAQLINSAEIAWHQGIDLYSIYDKRIIAALELYASLTIDEATPIDFYPVQFTGMNATFEIAYNHYHNRMGHDLPKTRALIERAIRPCVHRQPNILFGWCSMPPERGVRAKSITYPAVLDIAWETLTHAELGGDKTPWPVK